VEGTHPSPRSERRAESWNELQDLLFVGSWSPQLGRHGSNFAYRGLSDAAYPLTTSIQRQDNTDLERHLLRNFTKYAHGSILQTTSVWYWLATGQHHGLPTRLLDWTYSPFIALHFATSNTQRFDRDGVIWSVDFVAAAADLPAALQAIARDEGSSAFTVEMLERAVRSLGDLDRLGEGAPFPVFLEPPSIDSRIVNQFALFSMMSDASATLSEWLESRPHLYRRIVIPAELKWEVRDKLDQSNITERVLFPGLDGLSAWLTRHYRRLPPDRREG
jgi:hypothetical protein